MDWVFGTKVFAITDAYTYLALFEIFEFVLTLVILIIYYNPLHAFYNTKIVEISRVAVKKMEELQKYAAQNDEEAETDSAEVEVTVEVSTDVEEEEDEEF